jgi:hypothetical protein
MSCEDRFASLYDNSVRAFIKTVERLVATRPVPWGIWPKAKPAGSIDAMFRMMLGLDWEQVLALITIFDDEKAEQLRELAGSPEGDHAIRDGDR